MVCQPDVRAHQLGHLRGRGRVRAQVVIQLAVAQVQERLGVEALVGVRHVDGQHAADVRQVRRTAHRLANPLHDQVPALPAAHGVHERELGGVAVLAEQVHLVTELGEGVRQAGVVDVAAGASQQVAVEDQDPHRAQYWPVERPDSGGSAGMFPPHG